jgi:glycine/D-amino acid oxidase-like deaminating enzyme
VLPADGELHPARFVQGAQAAARARGARCFEHSPVLELDAAQPGSVRARTPGGEVHAQLALICTNARAGELLPWYADKVDPVRGQMLATGPAPRIFPQPIYADHGFDYWRQTPDGRIALGGWRNLDPGAEVGLDDVLHDEIQARMTAFLARFPELEGVAVTHRWSGTMGFSRDGLPLIGPAPGAAGALAAVGFTGHGFGFGWLAGEALAALVVDGQHPVVADLGPGRLR